MADDGAGEEVTALKKAITKEGYSSIEEMVTDLQKTKAALGSAEAARDKFSANNDEARRIIGSKGSEIGELKIKLERATQEIESLKNNVEGDKGGTKVFDSAKMDKTADPPTPSASATSVLQKSVDEQLKEIEEKMTEEQLTARDALLALVEDDDRAIELVENSVERLKFTKDIVAEKSLKTRPTTFRPKVVGEQTSESGESEVQRLIKRLSSTTMGPSGRAPVGKGLKPLRERQPDPRLH